MPIKLSEFKPGANNAKNNIVELSFELSNPATNLPDGIVFVHGRMKGPIYVNFSQGEASPEEMAVITRRIDDYFEGLEIFYKFPVRPTGFDGTLYGSRFYDDEFGTQKIPYVGQATLENVLFFPDKPGEITESELVFYEDGYRLGIWASEMAGKDVLLNPKPKTWCQLAERIHTQGWVISIEVTQEASGVAYLSAVADDPGSLAQAKRALKIYWPFK